MWRVLINENTILDSVEKMHKHFNQLIIFANLAIIRQHLLLQWDEFLVKIDNEHWKYTT